MLRGMAIQDDSGSQKMLKLFNVHHLPVDPADRFKAIFQEQPQWTLQALQPYIDDLQACGRLHQCHYSFDCCCCKRFPAAKGSSAAMPFALGGVPIGVPPLGAS